MSERYKAHLVRFLAAWLLSCAIIGAVLGWAFGIGMGLAIATGYLLAIRNGAPQDAQDQLAATKRGGLQRPSSQVQIDRQI